MPIQSIEAPRRLGFLGNIHGFWGVGLHPESQLIGRDAGSKFGVGVAAAEVFLVLPLHELEGPPLLVLPPPAAAALAVARNGRVRTQTLQRTRSSVASVSRMGTIAGWVLSICRK